MKSSPLMRWLGLVVPAILAAALALHTVADSDIWLHERVGHDILGGGGMPKVNGFSFTAPDYPWTDHEWLFQVAIAAVGRGQPEQHANAWTMLSIALAIALIAVLWRDAALPGRGRLPTPRRAAAMALPLVVSLSLLWLRIEPRAEQFSIVALALLAHWIDAALAPAAGSAATGPTTARRWLVLVSPRASAGRAFWLTVVWAQLHGFWILAPTLWLVAAVLAPLDRRLAGRGGATRVPAFATPLGRFGPAVATLLAGVLTPNHVHGLVYPFRALGQMDGIDLRQLIVEMGPLLQQQSHLSLTVHAFEIGAVWTAVWLAATAGRVSIWRALLMVAGFAAAAWSQRNLSLCAVAFCLGHAGYDPQRAWLWSRSRLARRADASIGRWAPAAGLVIAAALVTVWLPQVVNNRFFLREGSLRRFGWGVMPTAYPLAAAHYLRDLQGGRLLRLANDLGGASTLIDSRAGLVFVDGRTEAYPPAVWNEYLGLRAGGETARAILARRQVEAVVLAHAHAGAQRLLQTLLADPRWRVGFADESGIVLLPATDLQAVSEEEAATAARAANAPALRAAAVALQSRLASDIQTRAADRCLAMANLLSRGGLADEANALALRGLSARPDHPLLNHNVGNHELARGDMAAAVRHLRAALAASPGLAATRMRLGVAYFRQGDLKAAEREFRMMTRAAPGRVEGWANLADVRQRIGDLAGARAAMRRALKLTPDDPALRGRAAEMGIR